MFGLLCIEDKGRENNLKLSQAEVAAMAGIPLRTYVRFEKDCNGSFENYINVLRAFDKLSSLEKIFPSPNRFQDYKLDVTIQSARKKSLIQKSIEYHTITGGS